MPELEKGKRSIDIISCLEQGRYLSSLKYENDGMLRKAEVKDGKVRIPLEACAFYQNVRDKIRGSIPVTLACSVGQVHMPESTALLKF